VKGKDGKKKDNETKVDVVGFETKRKDDK